MRLVPVAMDRKWSQDTGPVISWIIAHIIIGGVIGRSTRGGKPWFGALLYPSVCAHNGRDEVFLPR